MASAAALVEQLFKNLPAPRTMHHSTEDSYIRKCFDAALEAFDSASKGCDADDAEFRFLVFLLKDYKQAKADGTMDLKRVLNMFAFMAVRASVPEDDGSAKARMLRYLRWTAKGKKDEDQPPGISASKPTAGSRGHVSHEFLSPAPAAAACAGCGKSGATARCTGCLVSAAKGHVVFATAYCDEGCQAAHWKEHRPSCHGLRRLGRASSIFRELVLHLVQVAGRRELLDICKNEQDNFLTLKLEHADLFVFQGKHVLQPYPSHLAGSPHTTQALSDGMCAEVLTACRPLFDMLVYPSCKLVERVLLNFKNAHVAIDRELWTGEHDYTAFTTHEVSRLTLPCGRQVAFDPTGAQFGWGEVIAPWDAYAEQRIHQVLQVEPVLPRSEDPVLFFLSGFEYLRAHKELMDGLVSDLEAKAAAKTLYSASDLLKLRPESFARARDRFVAAGKNSLAARAKALEASPRFKSYWEVSGMGSERATMSEADYRRWKRVWLSEEECAKHGNRRKELWEIWKQRARKEKED